MAEILVGTTTEGANNAPPNYFSLGLFQAVASATGATEFRVYSTASGNAKIAVYADNAGEPGALIVANNTGQACVSGWNSLTVPSLNIVSGTYYWLAVITDATNVTRANYSGGTFRYRAETYSTFTFPDPAGVGFNSNSYLISLAVWGDTGAGGGISLTRGLTDSILIGGLV